MSYNSIFCMIQSFYVFKTFYLVHDNISRYLLFNLNTYSVVQNRVILYVYLRLLTDQFRFFISMLIFVCLFYKEKYIAT